MQSQKRFLLFLFVTMAVLMINSWVLNRMYPPPEPEPVAEENADQVEAEPAGDEAAPAEADPAVAENPAEPAADETGEIANQWVVLGSSAADSPYRMQVVLSNTGAAVETIELNGGQLSLEHDVPVGYLGPLAARNASTGQGVQINLVIPGSAAANAGLEAGDVLTAIDNDPVNNVADLDAAYAKRAPGAQVQLKYRRANAEQTAAATLAVRPLTLLSREFDAQGNLDQASFLLSLNRIGKESAKENKPEIAGMDLREGNWEVRDSSADHVVFARKLPAHGLEVIKRYRLAKDQSTEDDGTPGYHLDLQVEVLNQKSKPVEIAYTLDGPTGLPQEGWWYASKVSHDWFATIGPRDVAYRISGRVGMISPQSVADEIEPIAIRQGEHVEYIGVDAQYFSALLLPQHQADNAPWFARAEPLLLGAVPEQKARKRLTHTTSRLASNPQTLQKAGESLVHNFRIFTGPKKSEVLANYQIHSLVYHGWFSPVSRILTGVLHFFYSIVGNYGLAIILLTVLVRGCLFPMSRKQAASAAKMQELQPELKRINEKYKAAPEQKTKATMELFRKHNYNPYGGCLLVFVQLPIFVGLYRGLMLDADLRQQPLIKGFDWCFNLASPDMLLRWDGFMPQFLTAHTGTMGPYLNFLPLVTMGLFIWQQKMFTPPALDEQAAMQQKVMTFMTIFMAFMFFKVPAGLCLYFIASSLWGITERKLLPKKQPSPASNEVLDVVSKPAPKVGGNGAPQGKKKQKRK